jgi:putative membrane-bound dehydrogenase-like protein
MQTFLRTLLVIALATAAQAADPLRVFIRGGKKSHGPNAHEHERFLNDWKQLLAGRGIKADGAMDWPTAEQLQNTDVLVMYAQDGGNATEEQKNNVAAFTKRGGGLVVIHTAAVSNDPPWWKSVIGGAWVPGKTKWKEGPMDLYFTENQYIGGGHPITKGAANFHLDDEIYYDMDISPEVRVLATSYTPNVPAGKKVAEGGKAHIYDIQPQIWTYEKDNYRAFVSIPGHLYTTFEQPNYRAILLRGIAWTGKRENVDEFCKPDEISELTYPKGGPQRPADTLKALEIHPDFNLTLVASEPLINKPMNFDWAPDGSLWVAETPEYPNGRRGMRPDYRGKEWKDHGGIDPQPGVQERPAHDKISKLIDTNGDGVMDKKEIFYEGLDLVTGLVFYEDGVIVTQAPDILWLRDTNHDGKADKVEKLYTGLGTNDTHAVINNPRWGWDGWIYATHGYSASNYVKNAKGETMPAIGSGVVRFKPDGSAIEQYSSKSGNTWGLEITADNRVMWTQPTSGELLMHTILPEYALARGKVGKQASYKVVEPSKKTFPAMSWEQMAYVQIDWVGSFTAAAGTVVYDGGSWPSEYNGDYFTTEPTINIIHHARLTPEGSSYTFHKLPGREETEFIRSKDMWWRPIEVRVGPDGAVYIGDFYNQAVIHNDTRGPDHNKVNAAVRPDRDHYYGRIWRLDHKQAKKVAVPNLAKVNTTDWPKLLEHPNRHVRMNAARKLTEYFNSDVGKNSPQLEKAIESLTKSPNPETRIAAIWTLVGRDFNRSPFYLSTVLPMVADKDAAVRRNVALAIEARAHPEQTVPEDQQRISAAAGKLLADPEAAVRLAALRALAASTLSNADAKAVIAAWPKFDDDFQRSAAVGAASRSPAAAISAALDSGDASLTPLVRQLAQTIGEKNDADAASKLVIAMVSKPASSNALKRSIFETLGKSLKSAPAMTPELAQALKYHLDGDLADSVFPIAVAWDTGHDLGDTMQKVYARIEKAFLDGSSEEERLAGARTMLGLANKDYSPSVERALTSNASSAFKTQLIAILAGSDKYGRALVNSFGKLPFDVQPAAFDVILQRADWSLALLDVLKSKQADASGLGPANLARLRTHPDRGVAERANEVLNELMGPALKAKGESIAKLLPVVEQPGDAVKGKALFTAACATCHKLGDLGADIGPALTGMGTHGPAELLTAIIDPNREVDPSFVAWNIETKDGKFLSGVIARENPATVLVKSLAGAEEVRVADIKTRTNTGRSLMPEGLEGLGGEQLRDILAYICGEDAKKFRVFDLKDAYTANSSRGLYLADDERKSIDIVKSGIFTFGGIPFNVLTPERSPTGKNVIQLKGGGPDVWSRRVMPASVEIRGGGFKANRLHFLGGIGGWAYPFNKDNMVVMKAVVHYIGGGSETLEFRNGIEFADHIARNDVPGSTFAEGVSKGFQVRWFSKQLSKGGPIDKIVLESTVSAVAPTTLAVTAELADANAKPIALANTAGPAAETFVPQFNDPVPQPPASTAGLKGPRVLLVGGGSSHDFVKFFGATDKGFLSGIAGWVDFTQNANGVPAIMKDLDVLVWSANQPIASETAKALTEWVNAGKPLVLLHPGTWYLWKNFPEWNSVIVGGGARGHDNYGEFEVTIENRAHPVTIGVTERFKITDELYNFIPDLKGTPIEVLASATSAKSGNTFPQVFIVKHPKARIVGITLGHDAKAHDLPEFQKLLKQAVLWAAGKTALAAK